MQYLIIQLIASLLADHDATSYVNTFVLKIFPLAFKAEDFMGSMGIAGMSAVFKLFFDFGISLIILKFLKKGFEQYVLWTSSDPDAEPTLLLIGFVKALVVAICFGEMYDWLVEVMQWLTDSTLSALGIMGNINFLQIFLTVASGGIFNALCMLVFFIMLIILYIDFIKRGLEIMILRVGLPIAAGGLMDSDGGVFRTYLQKFYQSAVTVLVQIAMLKLAMVLMTNGHLIWGIASISMAKSAPKFLQEFIILPGGGGGLNNVYQASRMGQMLYNAVSKGR